MEMKEMRALIERGFRELNARQDKLDQSISELKESIESSKAPKKGENDSSSRCGNSNTAMEMKEMCALIERGFKELNARQDKLDQSLSELKESVESAKAPKKGENDSSSRCGNSSTTKAKVDPVTIGEMSISMDAVVEFSEAHKGASCVIGYYENRPLKILFGLGGSSHNFIDESLADELGCDSFPIEPRTVTSAFGKMVTSRACNNFQLSLQGILFSVTVYLLPLSSNCEMVLGNQWMGTVKNVTLRSEGIGFYFRGENHLVPFSKSIEI